jgi:hypothetical protein
VDVRTRAQRCLVVHFRHRVGGRPHRTSCSPRCSLGARRWRTRARSTIPHPRRSTRSSSGTR